MEKDTKAENMQRIFISRFPSVQIQYFPKGLILDKEELILDMEDEIFFPKIKRFSFLNSRGNF